MNYFLGPYKQQELDDEVTLPISHRHLLQKKSKETKPLRNPLCLHHAPSVGIVTQSSDYHEHPTSHLAKNTPLQIEGAV